MTDRITNKIVLLGGGGHSHDILESIEATPGIEVIGFLDDSIQHQCRSKDGR